MAEENHPPLLVRLQKVGRDNWELVERDQVAEVSPPSSPDFAANINEEWEELPQPFRRWKICFNPKK